MSGTDPRRRRRARRRTTFLVALALALAPVVWLSYDLMLRSAYVIASACVVMVVVRRRTRPETTAEAYARALGESSALHVHLDGVRIAAVHLGSTTPLLTLTWRSATSVLLDADGRARGTVGRNALTSAWTWSIPVDDDLAATLLAREPGLGRVSVYGTVDVARDPHGTLRDSGVVLDQYDLAFPSWTGTLLTAPIPADRDT
jgi:hypothetical protein